MIVYLDTSALVKIYIREEHRDLVERALNDASQVATSVVAYPEARSAFARKKREGTLRSEDYDGAVHALDLAWEDFYKMRVSYEIAQTAGNIAERFALRGLDAVHLTTAMRIHSRAGDTRFLAFDQRLVDAARQVMPIYEIH